MMPFPHHSAAFSCAEHRLLYEAVAPATVPEATPVIQNNEKSGLPEPVDNLFKKIGELVTKPGELVMETVQIVQGGQEAAVKTVQSLIDRAQKAYNSVNKNLEPPPDIVALLKKLPSLFLNSEKNDQKVISSATEEKNESKKTQERFIADALEDIPKEFRDAAADVFRELQNNPEEARAAQGYYSALVELSAEARAHVIRVTIADLRRQPPPVADAKVQGEVKVLLKKIGPEGQKFFLKFAERVQQTVSEKEDQGREMTKEERDAIRDVGTDIVKKFKISLNGKQPTEEQKNLLVAQLQMAGAVNEPIDKIISGEQEVEAYKGEGGQFNQMLYRLGGLLSYVALHYQKLKDAMNPNKKKEAKEGKEELEKAGVVGKEGVLKMLKDSGKANLAVLLNAKTEERNDAKGRIDGAAGVQKSLGTAKESQAAAQQRVENLKQQVAEAQDDAKPALNTQLTDANTSLALKNASVEGLQQQLAQEQATISRLEGEIKSIEGVQRQVNEGLTSVQQAIEVGKIRVASNAQLLAILVGIDIQSSTDGLDLHVKFKAGADRTALLKLCDDNKVDISALGGQIDAIDDKLIHMKDVQVFTKVLNVILKPPPPPAA